MITAANRYGYRGSQAIRQYHTEPYEPSDRTRTPYTPKFLNAGAGIIDEWVPPIEGRPCTQGIHLPHNPQSTISNHYFTLDPISHIQSLHATTII